MQCKPDDLVTVKNLCLYSETEVAVLIGPPGLGRFDNTGNKQWLPSSLIEHNSWNGLFTVGEVEIPRWLAEDRDFDYQE